MKKITSLLALIIPSMLVSGCSLFNYHVSSDSSIFSSSSSAEEPSSSTTSYTPEELNDPTPVIENTTLYEDFWRYSSEVSISITMSEEAANFINTYQSDHNNSTYHDYYVPCTFILNVNSTEYTFEEVGIREKGNMSRAECLTDGHFSLDSLVHYKLSFKETFDDEEYSSISSLQQFYKEWND